MAIIFMIITFVGGVFVGSRLPLRDLPFIASLIDAGGEKESATGTKVKELLAPGELAKVIEVLDGDTIVIEGGEQVRYIGVDSPEGAPETTSVCYAAEAKAANAILVAGKTIRLVRDTNDRDPLNRLLRYVYVETANGGLMINEKLVLDGAAKATPYPPDVKFEARFATAEIEAKTAKRGLWATYSN